MDDIIFDAFLASQTEKLKELSANSDIFELESVIGPLFILSFHCKGLIVNEQGDIEEHSGFKVALNVSPEYLRKPIDDPRHMIAMETTNTFHPNIQGHTICVGKINASTPLAELVQQIYEILSYQRANPLEFDALNARACKWARKNKDRLPIDNRELLR